MFRDLDPEYTEQQNFLFEQWVESDDYKTRLADYLSVAEAEFRDSDDAWDAFREWRDGAVD